jgi:gluconokinase
MVMGVSGSGKSTVGSLLAGILGARFADADDFHPPENKALMAQRIPLTDRERLPWLQNLRTMVIDATPPGETTVLACSALKAAYRRFLTDGTGPDVRIVFLHGPRDLIAARLAARTGHFMPPDLLDSQFATLEPPAPEEAIHLSIEADPVALAAQAAAALRSSDPEERTHLLP